MEHYMFNLSDNQKQSIKAQAIASYEQRVECGGLILSDGTVLPLPNIASEKDLDPGLNFAIDPLVYRNLESNTLAIYHSHINGNPNFTPDDVVLCQSTGKPLILYDVASNNFKIIDPSGSTPLIGRDFCYGIYDCLSLVSDYYLQHLGVKLPEYDRAIFIDGNTAIWDSPDWNTIGENVARWGFSETNKPEPNDVIGFSIGINTHVNHLGVYIGQDRFIHQLIGRKSCEEIWGSPWANYAIKFWRYSSQP
jgi:proteasome lid subunit RPN8/RPN11